ncbi:MAG TPA: nucleotidyltransferase domain-containing protein [Anaerolineae bacterium]|nr:nucleotidyltransferase domain-containing protein [Anaerolineae bacterium]
MAFDTTILDEALARQCLAREKKRQAVLNQVLQLLDEWGPSYGLECTYIFGSLVHACRFDETSDVDIAVEQIDPERFFEAISTFSTMLGRQVDLIELDKCHFAHRTRQEGIQWTRTRSSS